MLDEFEEDKRIESKSALMAIFTPIQSAVWTRTWVVMKELVDEIGWLQVTEEDPIDFTSLAFGTSESTKYSKWPTKTAPKIYKFNSFWLELD